MVEEMRVREGYKKTEVGVIPKGWEVAHIESVAIVSTGEKNTQDKISSGGYPFYVRSSKVENIDSYSYDGEAVLTAGDGVGTGKVFHYVNGKFDFHQRVYKISDFKKCLNGCYFYLYFSNNFFQRVMGMTAKSSVDSVRREMITQMLIPIPPLNEQKAIAKVLTDTDNLIHSIGNLIAKKEKIKQGAMQELLTGKKRLEGFNREWEVKDLGSVSDIRTGKKDNKNKTNDGQYPFFVRSQHVERINSYSYDGEAILIPGEGGIGSIYHYINGRFDYHQRVYKISDFKGADGKYIYYFMKQAFNEHAMRNSVKATVDSLRLPTFQEFEIYCPPSLNEQQAIAKILSDMDLEIDILKEKLEKYKTIKQGMMQELLTGRTRLI